MINRLGRGRTRVGFRAASFVLATGFALAACAHAPHARTESADADARLASALADIDKAQESGMNNGAILKDESVVVDSGAARLHLEQIALEFPKHVPTLLMCAQLAFDANDTERAAAYADRVLALQPDNNFAGIIRSRCALADGNVPKAREVLRRQVVATPDSCYLHETLAGVEYFGGDLAASEKELQLAERFGAEPWRIAFARGLIAEKRGATAEAKKQYELASKLCPKAESPKSRLNGVSPPPPPPPPTVPKEQPAQPPAPTTPPKK